MSRLRTTHAALRARGRTLLTDSNASETRMHRALPPLMAQARNLAQSLGGTVTHQKTLSLYDCQRMFHRFGGGPSPDPSNRSVYMKPDGGVILYHHTASGWTCPVLIMEDKVQGTNDLRHAEGKPHQSCGNAVERAAKNIRGAEMLARHVPFFPYAIFASGCDFHPDETIAKRLEMMNYGFPNHTIVVTGETSAAALDASVSRLLGAVNPRKRAGGCAVASVFVKAHRYDESPHGTSAWSTEHITQLASAVLRHAFDVLREGCLPPSSSSLSSLGASPHLRPTGEGGRGPSPS